MRFSRTAAARLLLAIGLLWLSSAAEAQIRYVASTGRDTNPCTRAAPCLTLQRGIDATAASGELRVLGSSTFGSGTIGKSLTVSSDGGTIFGSITVNAPGATVVLRKLNLNGTGLAEEGIYIPAAAAVHIEHCEVERFGNGHGIYFSAPGGELYVTDTVSRDNFGAGLLLHDTSASPGNPGSLRLTVENSSFENNGFDGIFLYGGISTVIRSIVAGNTARGIVEQFGVLNVASTIAAKNQAEGYSVFLAKATFEASISAGNSIGLYASAEATVVSISNSVFISNSSAGIGVGTGASVRTRGNNTVVNNGDDVQGTLTPLAGQ